MTEGVDDDVFGERGLFSAKAATEEGPPILHEGEDGLVDIIRGPSTTTPRGVTPSTSAGASAPTPGSEERPTEERPPEVKPGPLKPRGKRAKGRGRDYLLYWIDTKYDVLEEVLAEFGEATDQDLQEAERQDDDVDLVWSDGAISVERFIKLKPYQTVNHFVGMTSITRKNNLGRNLLRMKKRFPEEYGFFPDTWILPTDLCDFKAQFTGKRNKTFIVKPSDGYQGRGIFLTRDFESISVDYNSTLVVQKYLSRPFLLDGFKFDFRLYVLVTGCDPLRIFLHEHGLVRLCSEEYVEPRGKNLQNAMMHLTNYAINCENPDFEENTNPEDGKDGHKRGLQAVLKQLDELGVNTEVLMSEIEGLVVKTLLAVQPSLSQVYHSCHPDDIENTMCFEILGFDVMLDYKAKPWLIEVNHAPSFRTETDLDYMVKHAALSDAFELVNLSTEKRNRYLEEQQQAAQERRLGTLQKRTAAQRAEQEDECATKRTAWELTVQNGYKRLYPPVEKPQEEKPQSEKPQSEKVPEKPQDEREKAPADPVADPAGAEGPRFPTAVGDAEAGDAGAAAATTDAAGGATAVGGSGEKAAAASGGDDDDEENGGDADPNGGDADATASAGKAKEKPAFTFAKGSIPVRSPPQDYEKLLEASVDIWEMMTGTSNARKKRKDYIDKVEAKEKEDEKGKRKVNLDDTLRKGSTPQRSPPGARQRPQAPVFATDARASASTGASPSSDARSRSAETSGVPLAQNIMSSPGWAPSGLASPATGVIPATGDQPWWSPAKKNSVQKEIPVGSVVQVQTNMGWESVVVRRKHPGGHLDIQFQDGEMMREVMPRILKQTIGLQPSGGVPASGGALAAAASSSSSQSPDRFGPRPNSAQPEVSGHGLAGQRSFVGSAAAIAAAIRTTAGSASPNAYPGVPQGVQKDGAPEASISQRLSDTDAAGRSREDRVRLQSKIRQSLRLGPPAVPHPGEYSLGPKPHPPAEKKGWLRYNVVRRPEGEPLSVLSVQAHRMQGVKPAPARTGAAVVGGLGSDRLAATLPLPHRGNNQGSGASGLMPPGTSPVRGLSLSSKGL